MCVCVCVFFFFSQKSLNFLCGLELNREMIPSKFFCWFALHFQDKQGQNSNSEHQYLNLQRYTPCTKRVLAWPKQIYRWRYFRYFSLLYFGYQHFGIMSFFLFLKNKEQTSISEVWIKSPENLIILIVLLVNHLGKKSFYHRSISRLSLTCFYWDYYHFWVMFFACFHNKFSSSGNCQ